MAAEQVGHDKTSGQQDVPARSLAEDLQGVNLEDVLAEELSWLTAHTGEAGNLAGQWVALDGDVLISHNQDLAVVLREAGEAGYTHPFIARVEDPRTAIVG